jgi:hypothetical protein
MSGTTYPSGPQTLAIPTTILLPSVATPFNPSTVNPSVEACWDAIKALQSYGFFKTTFDAAYPPYSGASLHYNADAYALLGTLMILNTGTGAITFPVAHSYARSARIFAQYDSAEWSSFLSGSGADPQYQTPTKTSTSALIFEFDLPDGCTIEDISLRVEPDNSHSALPNVMPMFQVLLADNTTGNVTLLATATDESATFGAYNTPHDITVAIASVAFGAWKNSLYVRVYGESGPDAKNGFISCIPIAKFKRTRIAEEFGGLLP